MNDVDPVSYTHLDVYKRQQERFMSTGLLEAVWARPEQRPELGHRDWETLLGQARQARLLARLAAHHLDHGWLATMPDGPRPHLEGALRLAERQQHEVRWEVDCIRRALKDQSAPVVLLKGCLLYTSRCV